MLLLWMAFVITAQSLIGQAHAMDVVHFQSAAPVPGAKAGSKTDRLSVWGHGSLPAGKGPFPTVVLLHGCTGLQPHYFRWARFLNRLGYLTLILDSFGPRSMVRTCAQSPAPQAFADRRLDSVGAHTYLVSRPDVDPHRIGLMGWSQGAAVALDLVSQQPGAMQPGFQVAVAFYPFCMLEADIHQPALIMIGEADDWSPADRCRQLTVRNAQVGTIDLIVYARAFHAFDMTELPEGYGLRGPRGDHWVKFDPRAYQDSMFKVQSFLSRHLARP